MIDWLIGLGVESKTRGELGEYSVPEHKWVQYFQVERMLVLDNQPRKIK